MVDWGDLERKPVTLRATNEGHMWVAVILQAVKDARAAEPDPGALAWLFSDQCRVMDFLWLCDMLDLPAEKIRNSVREALQPSNDPAKMPGLLRGMFSSIRTPFTTASAQKHLQNVWTADQVRRAVTKGVRLGVLKSAGRGQYARAPRPKPVKKDA